MTLRYLLTQKSHNQKTGPIPVSITSADSCPDACPMKGGLGCYAESGPLAFVWRGVAKGKGRSTDLAGFARQIAGLPVGALWRHNQAGDLPGLGDSIDAAALGIIVDANRGRRGFTYTHKPAGCESIEAILNARAIEQANHQGFTINLSADDLPEADALADLAIGPVVTVLPSSSLDSGIHTPMGRRVVVCPATTAKGEARGVTCASCGLCAVADRKAIVGFKAHGAGANKVNRRLAVLQDQGRIAS